MSNQKRNILIGVVIALIVLICCCLIVLTAVYFIDPYGVVGRMGGTYDPIAEVLPEGTTIYAYTDFKSVMTNMEEIQDLVEIFMPEGEMPDDMQAEFFEVFEDETGLSFEEDVQSWIGQYLGFSLTKLDYESLDYGVEPGMLVLAEVRPFANAKADEFLQKLMGVFEEDMEYSFEEIGIEGLKVYVGEFPYDDMVIVLARYKNILIGGNSIEALEDILQAKSHLSDSDGYKDVMKALPNDRLGTFYMDFNSLMESMAPFYEEMSYMYGADLDMTELNYMKGMAYSFSFDEGDPRMDFAASMDLENFPSYAEGYYETESDVDRLAAYYPEDTLFYMSAGLAMENLGEGLDELIEMFPVYEEMFYMLDEASTDLGFDIVDEFLVHLNGDMALGVFESDVSEYMPVDFKLMIESSDSSTIKDRVKNIALLTGEVSYVEHYEEGSLSIYSIEDYYGDPSVSFGTWEDFLVVAMSEDGIVKTLEPDGTLANSEVYTTMRDRMPKALQAYIHLDISFVAELLFGVSTEYQDDETTQMMEQLGALGFGIYMKSDNVAVGTMILEVKE